MKKNRKIITKQLKNTNTKYHCVNKQNILTSIILIIITSLSFLLDKTIINIVSIIQYPILFKFFYTTTLLGEVYIYIWIAIILTAALLANRKPVTAFVSAIVASGIVELLIKSIARRPRPFETLNVPSNIITSSSSFPSGHTMMFFVMIPILSKNFPKAKTVFWIIAILVGLSRIYLEVHYFSDVVAGAVFGYAIGWIFMKIGEKYEWNY